MNRILMIFFFWITCSGIAQQVHVEGTAVGRPGDLVRIIVYADQFSRLDSTVATTRTDVWGNFSLSFPYRQTNFAFLALGLRKGEFYMEPERSYRFIIKADTVHGSVFDQLPLQFEMYEDGELNGLIEEFNFDYNTFILQQQKHLLRARTDGLISDFIREEKEKFADRLEGNEYFSNYITYSCAALEWVGKVKKDSVLFDTYFAGKEVLYQNIAYTDFFRDFFKEYLKNPSGFEYSELITAFNSGNFISVDSLLKKDKWLAKDRWVRELSLMQLMARNFYNRYVDKERILDIFTEIEQNGNYVMNRKVATNFKQKLLHLNYGSPAPAFELKTADGNRTSLQDFTGKFVLLDFITRNCKPCNYDLKKLQEIQGSFVSELEVVVIVQSDAMEELLPFTQNSHFHFLDLNDEILLLENYEVKTYPAYILINPDGTVAMAPAPPPYENLAVYIERFIELFEKEGQE